jgi:hypothetical protein
VGGGGGGSLKREARRGKATITKATRTKNRILEKSWKRERRVGVFVVLFWNFGNRQLLSQQQTT